MRVVVAEDSLLLRAATARLLVGAGLDVVAQAGDAEDLLRKVRGHAPDVVVIDVRTPPRRVEDGVRTVRAIRRELPSVGVLVLSDHVHERYARELLDHGPHGVGYLLKDRLPEVARLIDAVRHVAAGGSVLDAEVVTQVLGRVRRGHVLDTLTDRDRDVLALMASGASNGAIARTMFLSERAIERHVTAIFRKLGLDDSRHSHRRVKAVLTYLCAG